MKSLQVRLFFKSSVELFREHISERWQVKGEKAWTLETDTPR